MSTDTTGEEAGAEVVLNRSTVESIEVAATYANVMLREEGTLSSTVRVPATAVAARSFTPGETVEVVLRRVAAQ